MYQLREIVLRNNGIEKKRLIIEFDDPTMVIVAEFLMADSFMMGTKLIEKIDAVLRGELEQFEISGNRCGLIIHKDIAVIHDLLTGIYDKAELLPTCEIHPQKLKSLIVMWFKKYQDFQNE